MKQKVKEILEAHGLDFRIEKEALGGLESGRPTPYFGLYHSKTGLCLNTVKAGYTVSQNEDIVDMVLQGTEKFGSKLKVSKAGSINEGRRVYIQLEIEGAAKIGDDTIKQYVTIIDSNDGSTSLSVGIGDTVMHCQNQFFKFYKSGEAKFRHTATIEQKIASIPTLVEIALGKSLEQIKVYKKFISTPLTKGLAEQMVNHITKFDTTIGLTARQKIIYDNLNEAISIEKGECGDNLWGLFNGVTRFTTHMQSVPKRFNGREESLINGTAYKKGMEAFEFCLDLV